MVSDNFYENLVNFCKKDLTRYLYLSITTGVASPHLKCTLKCNTQTKKQRSKEQENEETLEMDT
jgi:hypothetical protein